MCRWRCRDAGKCQAELGRPGWGQCFGAFARKRRGLSSEPEEAREAEQGAGAGAEPCLGSGHREGEAALNQEMAAWAGALEWDEALGVPGLVVRDVKDPGETCWGGVVRWEVLRVWGVRGEV